MRRAQPLHIRVGVVGMALAGLVRSRNLFLALRPSTRSGSSTASSVIGVLAIVAGVGGAALLFCFLNMFVEALPRSSRTG